MGGFDVKAYNKLPSIPNANTRFEEQLASAGITRSQLFSELAPLFLEASHAGNYGAWLIHQHYALNDGERMVTIDLSTKPSTEASPNIVCERWSSSGEEIEHKFTDSPASSTPPPADFFTRFTSILDVHGIDTLGVCYAPDELADGFIFLESAGLADREQVLTIAHSSASEAKHSVEAAWIPKLNPEDGFPTMTKCSSCVNPPCNNPECPKPPPPPPPPTYQTTHQVGKQFLLKEAQAIAKLEITI